VVFSEIFPGLVETAAEIGTSAPIGRRETLELLERAGGGKSLGAGEIVALINGLSEPANARTVLEYSRDYARPLDTEILLLPPLYVSSICENKCAYCDVSLGNGVRLAHGEFAQEVDALLEMGYRSIELVSSQDPELFVREDPFDPYDQRFDVSGSAEYFAILDDRLAAAGGGMITSNIPPVCTEGFGVLKTAGLECFLVWLETFVPDQYSRLHVDTGPKGNQSFRLDSFDRAREAGIEHVAGAFLKGLHDWRKEEVILYLFDRYLKSRWGRGFSIIGSPRVKGRFMGSMAIREHAVSDEEYELNIALDRVLFDGVLWLQTRESFDFNRRLINTFGGGVILTLTSCTAPGGYSRPAQAASQFPVFKQNLEQATAVLEQDGFTVRYAWGSTDLDAAHRTNHQS
jgi:2-iminoacetate synthase ThiH